MIANTRMVAFKHYTRVVRFRFVDWTPRNTLRCKLFPSSKFQKLIYY